MVHALVKVLNFVSLKIFEKECYLYNSVDRSGNYVTTTLFSN